MKYKNTVKTVTNEKEATLYAHYEINRGGLDNRAMAEIISDTIRIPTLDSEFSRNCITCPYANNFSLDDGRDILCDCEIVTAIGVDKFGDNISREGKLYAVDYHMGCLVVNWMSGFHGELVPTPIKEAKGIIDMNKWIVAVNSANIPEFHIVYNGGGNYQML